MRNREMLAVELLKDTAHHYLAREQVTVPQQDGEYVLLNHRGQELLNEVLERVERGDFRGRFKSWRWVCVPSGPWYADDVDLQLGVRALLNTYYNRVVGGKLERVKYKRHETTQTSVVLLHGSDWVYTVSGSLYALGKEKSGAAPVELLLKK